MPHKWNSSFIWCFTVLFCCGEDGYCINQPYRDPVTGLQNCQFRKEKLQLQISIHTELWLEKNEYNFLHHCGDLFSQFLVDRFAKIYTERLNYICNNKSKSRVEEYIQLRDAIGKRDVNAD